MQALSRSVSSAPVARVAAQKRCISLRAPAVRGARPAGTPAQQQQLEQQQAPLAAALLAPLAALATPLAAFAEEAAPAAADAAAAAAAAEGGAPSAGFYAVAIAPIVAYGLFYFVREKLNPKATLGDFAYIFATIVILGNILSIVVFKTRFF